MKGQQPKGGFKGFDSPGKGQGKGYQGYGGGKGYGYQGQCWKCGKIGHKANECTQGINEVGISPENNADQCSVEIGTVWNICHVENSNKDLRFESPNRFGALETCEQDSDSSEDSTRGGPQFDNPAVGPKRIGRFRKVGRKDWKSFDLGQDDLTWIQLVENKETTKMKLGFQVADVKKPLIAVKRICEKGNLVSFGPKEEDNYIMNKDIKDKMMLKPNGRGSYLMDVCFVGGERTQITVDSGAEENVCPWDWGSQFETKPADRWMNFSNASGGRIEHYGKRDVVVSSLF